MWCKTLIYFSGFVLCINYVIVKCFIPNLLLQSGFAGLEHVLDVSVAESLHLVYGLGLEEGPDSSQLRDRRVGLFLDKGELPTTTPLVLRGRARATPHLFWPAVPIHYLLNCAYCDAIKSLHKQA